jgi:threonine/homoserine/homoserine lactone efflux protein
VIYTISNSIGGGLHRGAFATIGCTLGIVPHILAAMLGLFSMIRDVGTLSVDGLDQAQSPSNGAMGLVVRRGFLINVLNPKLTVFFLAFLPQFLDAPPSLLDARLVALGGVFMLITLAVFAGYAYASSILRERVLGAPVVRRWFQRTLGALLIGLATRLAILDR